jgi:hypothetical protein
MRKGLWVLGGIGLVGLGIVALRFHSLGREDSVAPDSDTGVRIERRMATAAVESKSPSSANGAADAAGRFEGDAPQPDRHEDAPPPFSFTDYDENQAPTRELVRAAIEATIAERFTDYRLSSDELERATDALVELREAQEALRALPMGPETAEERRILVERIGEATSSFNEVLDMDPSDFTAESVPGVGVDRFDPNETPPDAEYIEDLR